MTTMDPQEFRSAGYLQEVNRQFLHPHGLSLAVDDDGVISILDDRDDLEGVYFVCEGVRMEEQAEAIRRLELERMPHRMDRLGYWVQPA